MLHSVCLLCGAEGYDISMALVRWKDTTHGEYGSIPRCKDEQACRRRVEEEGEEWPVVERETAA
jgi:hypothetical protein